MSTLSPSQIRYVWVDFEPDGTINAHQNGASVIKNSTGDFTVNFSSDMPSSYYHIGITPYDSGNNPITYKVISRSINSFRFLLLGGSVDVLGIQVISSSPVDPDIGISILACA